MPGLKIGVAQVDYTPPVGLPLMGNFRSDDYASRGIHDPLHAKAIVIADSAGEKIAMMAIDICMVNRENVALMREFIASKSDITPENIFISATHTHSGPAPMCLGSLPKADQPAIKKFLEKAATAVISANQNLAESKLAVGYATEDRIPFNRGLKCKDGKIHMAWEFVEPDSITKVLGPADPELITLSIEQQDKLKASIVNFGLHPAILAGDNWFYSADYPGYLSEAMAGIVDDDFITLFFNGCTGDVTHVDYNDLTQGRGYQMTQRVGYMLAVDAWKAIKSQTPIEGDRIAISSEKVALKRAQISEEQRKWCEEVLEKAKEDGSAASQVDGLPDEHYAKTWLQMYEKQNEDDPVEVMAIRIGDLGIVGLPGEIFCELGFEIKKNSPAKHTMAIELTSDAIGYLPNERSFKYDRYETRVGSTKYVKGSGERLAASAISQLNKLFEK